MCGEAVVVVEGYVMGAGAVVVSERLDLSPPPQAQHAMSAVTKTPLTSVADSLNVRSRYSSGSSPPQSSSWRFPSSS